MICARDPRLSADNEKQSACGRRDLSYGVLIFDWTKAKKGSLLWSYLRAAMATGRA